VERGDEQGGDRRTLLPTSMRAELEAAAEVDGGGGGGGSDGGDEGGGNEVEADGRQSRGGRNVAKLSRKEARKAARRGKKKTGVAARAAWTERRRGGVGAEKAGPAEGGDGGKKRRHADFRDAAEKALDEEHDGVRREERARNREAEPAGPPRKRSRAEKAEEMVAAERAAAQKLAENDPDKLESRRLEKLLGISKKRRRFRTSGRDFSYGDVFADDDDMAGLLQLCDGGASAPNRGGSDGGDSDGGGAARRATFSDASDSDEDDADALGLGGASSESDGEAAGEESNEDSEEGGDADSSDAERSPDGSGDVGSDATAGDGAATAPRLAGKYVPPGARAAAGAGAAAISRRVRGLLNRLAGSNARAVADDLVRMFHSDSDGVARKTLGTAYADAALDAVRDGHGAGQANPYVPAHAAIVAHLGGSVDASVAAQVIVALVGRMTPLLATPSDSREVFGYVALFGWLYDQRVVGCAMTYELVRLLSESLTETNVELLLLLLRSVGPALRAEDPAALRDVILHVREQATSVRALEQDALTSRVDVMLDLIYEIKDNKSRRKDVNDSGSRFSWVVPPAVKLQAALVDLADVEFVGTRWWEAGVVRDRVGASVGDADADAAAVPGDVGGPVVGGGQLMALAAAHRLNTSFRRQVFAAIMGSSDAEDALARLDGLRAFEKRDGRDRDTVRVLLHCCGAERAYNAFYGEIASRICVRSRALRFAFEFALWEAVTEHLTDDAKVAKTAARKARNFGKLLGNLLKANSLRLYALRVAPDLDSCSAACASMYAAVFDTLFAGGEADAAPEDDGAQSAVSLLCSETGTGAGAFRTSLAIFLRRALYPASTGRTRRAIAASIRALEAA
jgi:nucleolar MIF4G domain-containing protein 1